MAARYETTTTVSQNAVLRRSLAFFGPGGLGLDVRQRELTRIEFVGGGGGVSVETRLTPGQRGAIVELLSREWDSKALDFLDSLPKDQPSFLKRLPLLRNLLR